MDNNCMRIECVTIQNLKNVKNGELCLENKRNKYNASILGLYGQNGSGKTALIDSLKILKYVLCGKSIPEKYSDYIHVDEVSSTLKFQFKMTQKDVQYDIWYQFSMRKVIDDTYSNDDSINEVIKNKVEVYDEVLSFAYTTSNEKMRKNVLIDTKSTDVFVPKNKYQEFLGEEYVDMTEWLLVKRLVRAQSKSFIFSREMINAFRKNCKNDKYMDVIEGLFRFGNRELFVIDTENSGLISMNALPLSFKYKEGNFESIGNAMFNLDKPSFVPEEALGLVKKIIANMNIVLEKIIPGLTIGFEDLGPMVSKEGKAYRILQLISYKNKKSIPLQYESEGIKKIISVLQLLIVVYNNPSITVAIDELDAGIFEYLLGELLNIISEKGKGQLIFTSHNLRPLETIDKGFIAFTTVNPYKRYIRMINVKGNNNLRDFYYRDIVLGEQDEPVYNATNSFEIALAFREAGEAFGS